MANAFSAFHKTTPIYLDNNVSYYKETSIDNNFSCPVYMLDSSDNFTELARLLEIRQLWVRYVTE